MMKANHGEPVTVCHLVPAWDDAQRPQPASAIGGLARILHSQHVPSPFLPLPNPSETLRRKGSGEGKG